MEITIEEEQQMLKIWQSITSKPMTDREVKFAMAVAEAERERMLDTLTRHDWHTANIWRHYYPSATGDYVDLRELRKVLAPNAAADAA